MVTNYDVEYNYATSVSLMNDRLDGTTEDLDAGNIRYFGDYSLDTSDISVNNGWGTNSWSETDTMKLLNPGYESETVGGSLWWNGQNGTYYNGQNNSTTTCDFTNNGPSITIRDKIANAARNIGNSRNTSDTIRVVYTAERKSDDKWTGNVALTYPSDYGYATDLSICNNDIESYSSTNCKDNDWLYLSDMTQWLFMKRNHNFLNWELNYDGNIYWINSPSAYAHAIRPTLFLTDSVKIITGNGSPETPYQIEL